MYSASRNCCNTRALAMCMLHPVRIRGQEACGNVCGRAFGNLPAICCGAWESLEIRGSRSLRPAFLPAIFLPQRGDVGYVMASMPSVKAKCFLQSHNSQFGMAESPLPVIGFERAEEPRPARVQAFQQHHRNLYGRGENVGQKGPAVFRVGLDRRHFLCQRQLEADVSIKMAVRYMVH